MVVKTVKRRPRKGAAKVRRLGKHKQKIEKYYATVYPRRKIHHLLRNNSLSEAQSWADRHGVGYLVRDIANKLGIAL